MVYVPLTHFHPPVILSNLYAIRHINLSISLQFQREEDQPEFILKNQKLLFTSLRILFKQKLY